MPGPLDNFPPDLVQAVKDHEHLKLLLVFRIIHGSVFLLLCLYPLIYVFIGLAMAIAPSEFASSSDSGGDGAVIVGSMFAIIGIVFFVIMLVAAILMLLAAVGTHKKKWYWLGIIVSCFECILFPYGTAIGVFGLMTYTRPTVRALFAKQPA